MKTQIKLEVLAWRNKDTPKEQSPLTIMEAVGDSWWNTSVAAWMASGETRPVFQSIDVPATLPNKNADAWSEFWIGAKVQTSTPVTSQDFVSPNNSILSTVNTDVGAWGKPGMHVASYYGGILPFPFMPGCWSRTGDSLTIYRIKITSSSIMLPSWYLGHKIAGTVHANRVAWAEWDASPNERSIWIFDCADGMVAVRRVLREIFALNKARLNHTKYLAGTALFFHQHKDRYALSEHLRETEPYETYLQSLQPSASAVFRKFLGTLQSSPLIITPAAITDDAFTAATAWGGSEDAQF